MSGERELDLDAYLRRIDYSGGREPTLDTLTGLLAAHLSAIPFEHLDVLFGRSIDLSPAAVFDKLVARRRGVLLGRERRRHDRRGAGGAAAADQEDAARGALTGARLAPPAQRQRAKPGRALARDSHHLAVAARRPSRQETQRSLHVR